MNKETTPTTQPLIAIVAPGLAEWIDFFLRAKRADKKQPATIRNYAQSLRLFAEAAEAAGVVTVETITPDTIRGWVVAMDAAGIKLSTSKMRLTCLKIFLKWWAEEVDMPVTWRNPGDRVKLPEVDDTPLPPADDVALTAMIKKCGSDYNGVRDRAILLVLADTGCRASELCGLDLADFDGQWTLTFRRTKNKKVRDGFLGRSGRRALRGWLAVRGTSPGALFIGQRGRLCYRGLQSIIAKLARNAGVDAPKLHGIRRLFALTGIRQGVDLLSLSRLLGHSNLDLLSRYAKQTAEDLREKSAVVGLGDRL